MNLRPLRAPATVACWLALLSASSASGARLDYDVFSGDDRLGQLRVEWPAQAADESGPQEIVIETKLRVKALFLTLFALDSKERAQLDADGLTEYESHTRIDDIEIHVVGRRSGEGFRLETRIDDSVDVLRFARSDYDVHSIGDIRPDTLAVDIPETLRVLDLDELEIIERIYRRLPNEQVMVDGHRVEALVLELRDLRQHARRWYWQNHPTILLEERGEDADGTYRLSLRRLPDEEEVR
jgi:Domain of unknown function (DUF6134)